MITHYDLFAGIGGFSLALEEVFDEPIRHVFCEWEAFPTSVLKQHWPGGLYYGDIANLVADTECQGRQGCSGEDKGRCRQLSREIQNQEQSILTGGFPCQPFSHAGRRKGTADDRYQWPNMFAVIRNVKPEWVIAENVRGLVTWNEGLVLETVCADLESEGYEVQPFIIPAVAVGAPHRRDRIWIIGRNTSNAKHDGLNGAKDTQGGTERSDRDATRTNELRQSEGADSLWEGIAAIENAGSARQPRPGVRDKQPWGTEAVSSSETGAHYTDGSNAGSQELQAADRVYPDWSRNWQEVAFATCDDAMDDGISREMDGNALTYAKWRKESLKAFGNAIVPQVAMEIMKAILATKEKP